MSNEQGKHFLSNLVFQMPICQKNIMSEEQGHFLELSLDSTLKQCTTYLRSVGISDEFSLQIIY